LESRLISATVRRPSALGLRKGLLRVEAAIHSTRIEGASLVTQNVATGGGLAVQFKARHCGDRRVTESRPTLT